MGLSPLEPSGPPGPNRQGDDLRSLVEDFERSLILSALVASGGHQRRSAALLGVLPTTLSEKMKRLGIRAERNEAVRLDPASRPSASEQFRWVGSPPPGATIEVQGVYGCIHAEAAADSLVEVVAVKREYALGGVSAEVRLDAQAERITVSTVYFRRQTAAGAPFADVRVDLDLKVPAGVGLIARILRGNIEADGLLGPLQLHTRDGILCVRPANGNRA